MIVFLYGENTYSSSNNLRSLVAKYEERHEESVNFFEFNFEDDIKWDDFKIAVQVLPLFKVNKLIIAKNIFGKYADELKEIIKTNKLIEEKDVFLIIWEKLPASKLKKASFLMKDPIKHQEFHIPEGKNLNAWVKREFQSRGLDIETAAVDALLIHAGTNIWRLVNEMNKVTAFRRSGKVTEKDIEMLVVPDIEKNVFDLTDAILTGNRDKAFVVLERFLGETNDQGIVVNILAVIASQFRNLLIIKDLMDRAVPQNQIASKSGLHPFVVKKSTPALMRFELDKLKHLYGKISSMEIALKNGKLSPLLAFDMFLLSV